MIVCCVSGADDINTKGFSIPSSCRPPPASVSRNLGRLIFCQVCGHIIEVPLGHSKLVVLCSNCKEATPAHPPPSDRRFFRCTCGRLILVPVHVHSVYCPRPECHQLLRLPAAKVEELTRPQSTQMQPAAEIGATHEMAIETSTVPGQKEGTRPIELRCGFCYSRFFAPSSLGLTSDARCPHCSRLTSVGPDFSHRRAISLGIYSFISLAVAVSTSVITYVYREQTAGLHSVNIGLGFGGLVMGIKAIGYYRMPVSRIVIGGCEM
ncbi:unnamed protein product [Dicrocoelium dendriticum]|nr:unnamed protein product [Dicrocoelium dendriticum]